MKKRKITEPCEFRIGICNTPCATSKIMRGISSVVTNPIDQGSRENSASSEACTVGGNAGSCLAL